MLTQSDLEREKYEAKLKYQRDEVARLRYAEQTGEKRGFERGMKRGFEWGVLIGRVRFAEQFLKKEPTRLEMLRAMSPAELRELADKLESQLIS